jgi:hypothetical protein
MGLDSAAANDVVPDTKWSNVQDRSSIFLPPRFIVSL